MSYSSRFAHSQCGLSLGKQCTHSLNTGVDNPN